MKPYRRSLRPEGSIGTWWQGYLVRFQPNNVIVVEYETLYEDCETRAQAAFPNRPNWGPTWPNRGPIGAHMECCLGGGGIGIW